MMYEEQVDRIVAQLQNSPAAHHGYVIRAALFIAEGAESGSEKFTAQL
jgi:hypothetical protein